MKFIKKKSIILCLLYVLCNKNEKYELLSIHIVLILYDYYNYRSVFDILLVYDKQKHRYRINNNVYNAIIIAPGGV